LSLTNSTSTSYQQQIKQLKMVLIFFIQQAIFLKR